MKKWICGFLTLLLLTGCSWNGSTYVQVTPRSERTAGNAVGTAPAENEMQLRTALQGMVAAGRPNGVIYTLNMDADALEQIMAEVCQYVETEDAVGDYALDDITYEIGTTGGKTAVACTMRYRHSAVEIRKILHLRNIDEMKHAVSEALEKCSSGVVMLVDDYTGTDFAQLVQDIARATPQSVMETPEVVEEVYGTGSSRVVELSFSYENSREALRQMQSQVTPVFASAALYVSGEGSDFQKFSQLYAFLMERFDYTIETSITPAYSLLRHGVGDSRAFATVYAAMCANAGLDCRVVTGTRLGDPWTWNIIRDNGLFYHVDLLANSTFREVLDTEMNGYVWDYSAYPSCLGFEKSDEPEPTEETLQASDSQ